ncbi:hypothetical protein HPB51_027447 [Rhipicephalus microplus]|uniref:Uncharacterized protein n=1 Tax=Rhipicephalus microplus TaxID=6941 RepID=A0A9J6D026_RHIMP|nr:hypothetical protein HPB51_027447 [Rhipicephalus microplus]
MDPLKGASKTKKRERPRRKSAGSATGELPRITSGIQKRRRSRGTIDNAQEMTLTVTQGSLLTREQKTDDEDSGTSAGISKNAKGKRRRYFRDDSSAFAGPSKEVDAPTTHDSHKPAAHSSAPPSSNEKDGAVTNGYSSRMLVPRSDHEGLPQLTPIRRKTEAIPQPSSAQAMTGNDGTKIQGSQLGVKSSEVGIARSSATPSRKSSTVKTSVPESTDQSPKRSASRRSSVREDSRSSERRPTMPSFLQGLNVISNERSDHRTKRSSPVVFNTSASSLVWFFDTYTLS